MDKTVSLQDAFDSEREARIAAEQEAEYQRGLVEVGKRALAAEVELRHRLHDEELPRTAAKHGWISPSERKELLDLLNEKDRELIEVSAARDRAVRMLDLADKEKTYLGDRVARVEAQLSGAKQALASAQLVIDELRQRKSGIYFEDVRAILGKLGSGDATFALLVETMRGAVETEIEARLRDVERALRGVTRGR